MENWSAVLILALRGSMSMLRTHENMHGGVGWPKCVGILGWSKWGRMLGWLELACIFKVRPGVLSETLSYMWGKLNLPIFLFNVGLLILISIESLIFQAKPCPSLPIIWKFCWVVGWPYYCYECEDRRPTHWLLQLRWLLQWLRRGIGSFKLIEPSPSSDSPWTERATFKWPGDSSSHHGLSHNNGTCR